MKNIEKIAASILNQFYVRKPLKLKEGGATRQSLSNAKEIFSAGYDLIEAIMNYDKVKGNYRVECLFKDPFDARQDVVKWVFTGFAIGYGGEGPRGLDEAMKLFGVDKSDYILGFIKTPEQGTLKLK